MSRILSTLLAAVLGLSLLSAPEPLLEARREAEPAAAFTAASVSTAHPFGDPSWYPLRTSDMREWARIRKPAGRFSSTMGCSWGNPRCPDHNGRSYHPYYALDFNADKGDSVYAAGWGVFHVGAATARCVTSGVGNRGIWAWVDHGGGVTSRYHHLDSVRTAIDGQLVGPSTKIGEVGISGSQCDAKIHYLHFAVTNNGPAGRHVNPGRLRACQNGRDLSYPRDIRALSQDWGIGNYSGWREPVYRNDVFPWGDSSCIHALPRTPNQLPRPGGVRGNETATIRWVDPSRAAGKVTVQRQLYAPSVDRWSKTAYRHLRGSARSTRFTGLTNGRLYRFRVAYRNAAGYAAWSAWRYLKPAAPPDAPRRNYDYPQAGRTNVRYAWRMARDNGAPVTGYYVVIRRKFGSSWGRWNGDSVGPRTFYKRWDGLRPGTTYGMRVLARSGVGPSRWTRVSVITTPR